MWTFFARAYLTMLVANSEAAVAFSGAEFCCGGPINPVSKLSDYHPGEIHLLEDGKIRRDFLPPPSPEHRRIAAERFERARQVITTGNLSGPSLNVSGANLSLGSVTSTGGNRGYYSYYLYVPRLGNYQYVTDEMHVTASGTLATSGNISSS